MYDSGSVRVGLGGAFYETQRGESLKICRIFVEIGFERIAHLLLLHPATCY
jgi:hypothetical protein